MPKKEKYVTLKEKKQEVTGKVIKMAQKEYIKHLYEIEEKSLSEISRICGLNYRTVAKYAKQENWNEERERKESNYPVLGEYLEIID